MSFTGMLSPRTSLGLEAKKSGLGLETLRLRGLIYCNVLISCAVENICQFQIFSLISETATVKSVVMKTKDGNIVNEARSGRGREKIGAVVIIIIIHYYYYYVICH